MRHGTAGWRQNIPSVSDILLAFWGGVLVVLFILFVNVAPKIPMDSLTLVTFMMAIAIWITAIISLISTFQSRDMLKTNRQMLEEMRKARPKPCVRADIVKNLKRPGYDLIVENIGRELAQNIKVHYCSSEIPRTKFGKGQKAFGENDLVDSNWIELDVKPLGPKDKTKFPFDFVRDLKICFVKFEISYSDGVESYKEPQYRIDAREIK